MPVKEPKCYICKKRYGKIQINKMGDRICEECNRYFDMWFVLQRLKGEYDLDHVRDAFIVSRGNMEVLRRIPEMMAKPEWRNKLRGLVIEYIAKG